MVEFALPRNFRVREGKRFSAPEGATNVKTFKVS